MNGIGLKELAFVGYPVTDFAKARRFYGEIHALDSAVTYLKSKDVKIVMEIQDFPFCRMASSPIPTATPWLSTSARPTTRKGAVKTRITRGRSLRMRHWSSAISA